MDFVLGYFAIGLLTGLIFAVVNLILSMFEGSMDWLGSVVVFSFGFLLWPVTIPVVLWSIWKERA